MKLFKNLKKGFTLIELVVVIAVIAILSAVSVVSYVAITNKAKASSDEQAVRQMNTALKAQSIMGASDITDLFNVLAEEGMDVEDYKPLSKDTFFFWNQDKNEIVYAKYKDGEYVGIYPEAYKDKTKGNDHWLSLSKEIKKVDVAVEASGNYTVNSAEQLYTIMSEDEHHPTSLTLTSDIDLMGADITFKGVETFNGAGKTLSNLNQLAHESFESSQKENRNSGLFGKIDAATYPQKKLTIENLKIENTVVGSASTASCGILAASIYDGVDVVIKNVEIKNSTVYSLQKGGILVGYLSSGSLEVQGTVSIEGCKVATLYGESGKLVGAIGGNSTFINKIGSNPDVKLEMLPTDKVVEIKSACGETITKNGGTPAALNSGYLVWSKEDSHNWSDKNREVVTDAPFRMFNENALFSVVAGATARYGVDAENLDSYVASNNHTEVSTQVQGHTKSVTYGCVPVLPSML